MTCCHCLGRGCKAGSSDPTPCVSPTAAVLGQVPQSPKLFSTEASDGTSDWVQARIGDLGGQRKTGWLQLHPGWSSRIGYLEGPFSCPEAWSCPRAGSAVGCDLGRMAALGREAPAHVHSSAGAWSQPKVLSRLQWAPLSLLGLLAPSPSPHWTPDGSPTSVAVVSASALPLPTASYSP